MVMSRQSPLDSFTCKFKDSFTVIILENHCNQTAKSSCGGCSRQVHKIVYLAVNKGNNLLNVLLLKIFIANNYHLKYSCIYA